MRKPKAIIVFGRKFKVKYGDIGADTAGICDKKTGVIYVSDKHESEEELFATILHECIHAVHTRLGIDLLISVDVEEQICENISRFLIETFNIKFK